MMLNFRLFQDVVLELLKEAMISKLSETKCFLIDGYPREMDQGTRFENEVSGKPRKDIMQEVHF